MPPATSSSEARCATLAFLVERWWRERERRQEERLLVLPE